MALPTSGRSTAGSTLCFPVTSHRTTARLFQVSQIPTTCHPLTPQHGILLVGDGVDLGSGLAASAAAGDSTTAGSSITALSFSLSLSLC